MKAKLNLLFCVLITVMTSAAFGEGENLNAPQVKTYRIERKISEEGQGCIDCHAEQSKGMVADWAESRHAHASVTCIDCHKADAADKDISVKHSDYSDVPVSAIVSPKDCSRCHPTEAAEYAKSKHANTIEIMWNIKDSWLAKGLNSEIERTTGCYACHGTVVKIDKKGNFDPLTWPNVGVGRMNPDGSLGSCSSCHTRHKFSVAEARKPQACAQSHLGPDHPQIEIYHESKHGAIYATEGDKWKWDSAPGTWTPGVDYRAPTCSTCHMSAINGVKGTHDVTERLAWETQAPVTVRPSEFKPWPAKTDWKEEREKMKQVCLACHSPAWTDGHFNRLDAVVKTYNDDYFIPMKAKVGKLYEKKLLNKDNLMDEKIEIELYELWHHEGRRARFGAAMMAPDYAWWHGFYEMKKRCMEIDEMIDHLEETGKPAKVHKLRGTGGDTTRPDFSK
ncbi:MAG: hydroxylamine oxidoreductase [Phycisphaerae bacterium]|nr:hydroxylamine oxidoreductase [Phycisphaerae bacterium]